MKLSLYQQAPDFSTTDVYGASINLKNLRGKRVYLAFERNAGCPVCNLRMHTLLKQAEHFKKNNITVLMVYESSTEKMKEYLGRNDYPFHFIADPENALYQAYYIEQSLGKALRSLFNGIVSKVTQGKRLFKKPMKQDGHASTIPSEFVIGEDGKLAAIHYGRYIGDHLPIDAIL
jgi:peroxiredoxin Q/BCP